MLLENKLECLLLPKFFSIQSNIFDYTLEPTFKEWTLK